MCPPGSFVPFTQEAPLYVTKIPVDPFFAVPCAVAEEYFGFVATKCNSAVSILTSLQVGNSDSCEHTTQIDAVTTGTSATVELRAAAGCESFTPGLLLTVGFSNNTAPGPVQLTINWVGSDGCAASYDGIRCTLKCNGGAGTLAVLFGCEEESRLYPVIARLRTSVVQLAAGLSLPLSGGAQTLTADVPFPDEIITVTVNGPAGMTLTVETLTWNHPTISCLYVQSLGWQ